MGALKSLFRMNGYSRRFYIYFLSYILLLSVVLLILGLVVYSSFISMLQADVENSNISALMQLKTNMDMRINEMERIAVNIYLDPDLRPYMVNSMGDDSLQIIRHLNRYKLGNEFLYDMELFHKYNDSQKIYTTSTVSTLDIFFGYHFIYSNWGKEEFIELTGNIKRPEMRPVEKVTMNMGINESSFATFIYPLPLNSNNPYTFVLFQIKDNVLIDMVENVLKGYKGYVFILDDKNTPVTYIAEGAGEDALSMLDLVNLDSLKQNINNIKINNENYSVVKLKSDYNRWSYITLMRTDQFMEKVYTRRNIFNLVFTVVLMLGTIIAFVMAAGNYKPLRRLIELLPMQTKIVDLNKHIDEYSLITKAFNDVTMENKGLINKLSSQTDIMKEQIILKFLKKKQNSKDEVNNLKEMSAFNFEFQHFAVLVLLIDDYNQFSLKADEALQIQIKAGIINLAENLSREIGCGYGAELVDEGGIVFLLNLKEGQINERHISELSYKIKDYFKQHFGFTLTIGIGNTYDNMAMAHESFAEASRAANYRLIKGNDNVIFYVDLKDNQQSEYKYPSEKEKELIIDIRQGKNEEIEKCIKDIREFAGSMSLSPETVRFIYFGIINSIIRALDELDFELPADLNDDKKRLLADPIETFDKLAGRIADFSMKISGLFKDQKESKNFGLSQKLINIIHERYSDNTLSLEKLADECGLSPSYVSRFFKDHTGYPPTQYIDAIRMEKAKELLKSSNLPIKDILSNVGYIDESNFIRKFKKNEGITPMQYRGFAQNE